MLMKRRSRKKKKNDDDVGDDPEKEAALPKVKGRKNKKGDDDVDDDPEKEAPAQKVRGRRKKKGDDGVHDDPENEEKLLHPRFKTESRFKGVSFHITSRGQRQWTARSVGVKPQKYLGVYIDEFSAAQAVYTHCQENGLDWVGPPPTEEVTKDGILVKPCEDRLVYKDLAFAKTRIEHLESENAALKAATADLRKKLATQTQAYMNGVRAHVGTSVLQPLEDMGGFCRSSLAPKENVPVSDVPALCDAPFSSTAHSPGAARGGRKACPDQTRATKRQKIDASANPKITARSKKKLPDTTTDSQVEVPATQKEVLDATTASQVEVPATQREVLDATTASQVVAPAKQKEVLDAATGSQVSANGQDSFGSSKYRSVLEIPAAQPMVDKSSKFLKRRRISELVRVETPLEVPFNDTLIDYKEESPASAKTQETEKDDETDMAIH